MNIVQSICQTVTANWGPLPIESKFGYQWRKIDQTNLEQHYTGETFKEEPLNYSLVKTAGLICGGSLFFAGATAYHLGKTVHEAYLSAKTISLLYKCANEGEEKVGLLQFIREKGLMLDANFFRSLKQAGKTYLCWTAFAMLPLPHIVNPATWGPLSYLPPIGWLADTNLGFYAGLGFALYVLYDPRFPKILLKNRIEKWVVVSPSSEAAPSTTPPGFLHQAKEFLELKMPISRYLGWEAMPYEPKEKKEE